MSLLPLQQTFSQHLALLIQQANTLGYGVTMGETWRSPETAQVNAAEGKGIANSLHTQRLAVDINLIRDGNFLTDPAPYKQLGDWWKALGPDHYWGGDFSKPDSDHYSISPDGGHTR